MNPTINTAPVSEMPETHYMEACMFALEPFVDSLFNAALKAGWGPESILLAIINIAANNAEKIKPSLQVMHS